MKLRSVKTKSKPKARVKPSAKPIAKPRVKAKPKAKAKIAKENSMPINSRLGKLSQTQNRTKKKNAKVPSNHEGSRAYILRLFVAGATVLSHQAMLHVRELCESQLKNRYTLKVIDIYQQPGLVRENQIVVTPTLIKDIPTPSNRFVGSLAIVSGLAAEIARNG